MYEKPYPVRDVDVCPRVQQVLDNLSVALYSSDHQRSVSVFISHIHVGVSLKQLLHHLSETTSHGHYERSH